MRQSLFHIHTHSFLSKIYLGRGHYTDKQEKQSPENKIMLCLNLNTDKVLCKHPFKKKTNWKREQARKKERRNRKHKKRQQGLKDEET